MKNFFGAALLASLAISGAANAETFGDEVTYYQIGGTSYGWCIGFQTVKGGGLKGVDNSPSGNSSAPGYTGGATIFAIGVGPAGAWTINDSQANESHHNALGTSLIVNSRYSPGVILLDYTDLGVNTGHVFSDYCKPSWHIVSGLGQ